jgi:hypothetical protein
MNEELDIDRLKKSWKEQDDSKQNYSQEELALMLNKKSSNNVKYIVIISIIEFIIFLLSFFFMATDKNAMIQNLDVKAQEIYIRNYQISRFFIYMNVVISLGFVFYFYRCYKKINLLYSTKDLIRNILKFRKSVNWFIIINVFLGLMSLFLTGFYEFMYGVKTGSGLNFDDILPIEKIHTPFSSPGYVFLFIIICIFLILLIIIYYLLIYGILLRKLKMNLKELQKLEINKE